MDKKELIRMCNFQVEQDLEDTFDEVMKFIREIELVEVSKEQEFLKPWLNLRTYEDIPSADFRSHTFNQNSDGFFETGYVIKSGS